MEIDDARIKEAVARTEILRTPKSNLLTFGTTNIYYYLVTEPAYADLNQGIVETVVREGRVMAEKPRIVTPYYLNNLEGFSANAPVTSNILSKPTVKIRRRCSMHTKMNLRN